MEIIEITDANTIKTDTYLLLKYDKFEELVKEHKDSFKVIHAGFLQTEYEYETVEYAVRVEPKIIK